jgi:hypothetical protein
MTRRLARDWRESTGQRLALVETFVDESRFQGTCYRAANWLEIGRTSGRTRDDRYSQIQVPAKRVLVLPLQPLARLRRELAG